MKNCVIRGISVNQDDPGGKSLVLFCEALAHDTIKQGLKEGLGRVIESSFLNVKIPKPSRRFSLLQKISLEKFEENSVNVKMSVTEVSQDNVKDQGGGELPVEQGNFSTSGDPGELRSSNDIEFLALDVQALEQMKVQSSCGVSCLVPKKSVVVNLPPSKGDIVRSATDFDIKSKRGGPGYRRPVYDPCSIYDITEFPPEANNEPLSNTMRSASASAHLASSVPASNAPQVPPEMVSFLEEPLLLVGHKLEWEGDVNARKISNARRRKRQQQLTPQEQKKITRIVIGYTLAFFLLVIVTFYIVYFV
ncbi:RNA replication polyprotein [Frankliniella fusca]|uniref:RNA replication polyprotein n=1 Tax=Frankliniella fusca TaxID=407009 RepID=A0AAE1LD71_9NEOP|nr:RNA replication polyprotein [Frankliniella fusca]